MLLDDMSSAMEVSAEDDENYARRRKMKGEEVKKRQRKKHLGMKRATRMRLASENMHYEDDDVSQRVAQKIKFD